MKQDMIVILDLGSHENTVLARAIRALGVYSEIYPHDITVEELKQHSTRPDSNNLILPYNLLKSTLSTASQTGYPYPIHSLLSTYHHELPQNPWK